MKKLLVLAIAAFVFSSCNKIYECNCVSVSGLENNMTYQTNQRAHAKRLCDDWQTRIRTAIEGQSETTCTLK